MKKEMRPQPLFLYNQIILHPVNVYSHNPDEEGVIYTSAPCYQSWNDLTLNQRNPNNHIFVRRAPDDYIIYQQSNKLKWRIPNSDGEFYEKKGIYYARLGLPNLGRSYNPNLISLSYRPNRNQDLYPLFRVRFRFPDAPWILGINMNSNNFDLYRSLASKNVFDASNFFDSFDQDQTTINYKNFQLNLSFGDDIIGTFENLSDNKYCWFRFPSKFDYYSNIGDVPLSFDCEQREEEY